MCSLASTNSVQPTTLNDVLVGLDVRVTGAGQVLEKIVEYTHKSCDPAVALGGGEEQQPERRRR